MFADRYQLVAAYIIREYQSASVKVVWMKSRKTGLVKLYPKFRKNGKKNVKNKVTLTLICQKHEKLLEIRFNIRKIQAVLYWKSLLRFP